MSQTSTPAAPPVLIVGGRTTGLMLAIELTRQEIPVRIIDASPGIDPHSRATLIHVRSLELLQRLGLGEVIRRDGQADEGIRVFVDGAFHRRQPDPPVESPFPTGIAYSQAKLEGLLEAHLKSLGVTVERSTKLVGLSQDDSGVRAVLQGPDGAEELVACEWLVGCDGAHSSTRHLLGLGFPGEDSRYPYLLADVVIEGADHLSDAYYFLHPSGDLFFFLLDDGRRLICASLPEEHDTSRPPSLEAVQALVAERGGPDYRLSDPLWLANFRIRYRLVEAYRQGRVFLAGDAAHLNSLLGGLGMNTGLQDACNLAWKLALVVRGIADPALLDSYGKERRPVAADVIEVSKSITEPGERYPFLDEAAREALIADLFPAADQVPVMRRHLEELDISYAVSPLCLDRARTGGLRAGDQARNVTGLVCDGTPRSLFDLLDGTAHRLLIFAPSAAAVDPAGDWIEPLLVAPGRLETEGLRHVQDPEGRLLAAFGLPERGLVLIRPDGYIAFRSERLDDLPRYLATLPLTA
ncbi:MAG: FAD-dependent monooxygenase [Pseudomonadota bacterium]